LRTPTRIDPTKAVIVGKTNVPRWCNAETHGASVMNARDVPRTDGLELPEVISRYQDAHDRRDTGTALSAFAPNARVLDDGRAYSGSDEIRDWLDHAASEYTFTRSLVRAEATSSDTWLVVNHLEGNFPGGVVDLRYQFVVTRNLISELVIAP
jgi:hypothetical protein